MTAVISGTNGLLQSYDYQVSTTGFSYTFAAGTQTLVINPAGTLATGTITMPASPSDGMVITFSSTKIITALTVNANTGQTINNAVTTLAAGQSASYVYRTASTAWFPFTNVATASSYGGPRAQLFTTTGAGQTFTIPTGVTSVKVTLQAGGGGGGGQNGCNTQTSGAGAIGGAGVQWFVGLTPGNTLTVSITAGGGAGGTGANGSTGGAVSVASGTQTITTISATGGGGGVYAGAAGSAGTGSGFTNGGSGGAGFTLISGTYWNPLNRGMGGAGATPGSGPSGGTNGGVLFEY